MGALMISWGGLEGVMTQKLDLVVIGGGSGGLAAAQRAAEYGAKVALVEAGRLGGTCVNVGCVPKKIMWNAAAIAHVFHEAGDYGFTARIERFDWPKLRKSRDDYVTWLNGRYQAGLEKNGVEIVRGSGRFESAHAVAVDGVRLEARRARHHLGWILRARRPSAAHRDRRRGLCRGRAGGRPERARVRSGAHH